MEMYDNIEGTLKLTDEDAQEIIKKYYGLKGGGLQKLLGFDDLNYKYIPEETCNPYHPQLWPYGYVLKITNHLDSKNNDLCEAQNNIMLFLKEDGKFRAPLPIKNVAGNFYTKIKLPLGEYIPGNQREHLIRVLEYLPGTVLKDVPFSYPLLFKLGKYGASLTQTLKRFSHPTYKTHTSIWHLRSVPEIKKYLSLVENKERRLLAGNVIEDFSAKVVPKEESLERGIVHGDLNENNILMTQTEEGVWDVFGILDFGDTHFSCYLFDLAVAECYMMLECKKKNLDPIVGAGHFLAGYILSSPQTCIDYALLKLCICARLCQSLVLGLKAFSLHPENTYVLGTQPNGWGILQLLWQTSDREISRVWDSVLHLYGLNSKN